jgi:outer membrane protein
MERLAVGYRQAKEYLLPTISADVNHSINNGRSLNTIPIVM